MKNNLKRCLAMFLAVMMVVGSCVVPVFAANTTPEIDTPDTETCEHNWSEEPVATVKATCTTQGYDLYYCDKCFDHEQRNITKKTDHVPGDVGEKLPTCAASGHPAGSACTVCGTFLDEIPAADKAKYEILKNCGTDCANGHDVDSDECIHNWGNPESDKNPCLEANVTLKYTCLDCKITHEEKSTTATGKHTWEYNTSKDRFVEPDCVEDGFIWRECKFCDAEHKVIIKALGHKYEISAEGATAEKCGSKCSVCGDVKASNTNHTITWTETKAPDCTNKGEKAGECTCGYKTTGEIPANGHDKKGNGGKKVNTVQPIHTYDVAENKATLVDGYDVWNCSVCGENWNDYTDALKAKHDENGGVIAEIKPTCTLRGVKTARCSCNMIVVTYSNPTGHTSGSANYDDYDCIKGGVIHHICSVCNVAYDEVVEEGKASHEWKDAPTIVPGKCGVDGYKRTECKRCSAFKDLVTEGYEMPTDHKIEVLYTFGDGCYSDIITYKYCTTGHDTCEYNCKVDVKVTATNKHETIVANLDARVNASTGKVWKEVVEAENTHIMSNMTIIIPSTCDETGWWGYYCQRETCGLQVKTHPVETGRDVNNHAYPDEQVLVHFRWTCGVDADEELSGEQLYSTWYCEVCQHYYTKKTVVPKEGITLEVGVDGLETITLYAHNKVNVVIDSNSTNKRFIITGAQINNTAVEAGSAHIWAYAEDGDKATCGADGFFTCVLCRDKKDDPAAGAHTMPSDAVKNPDSTCTETGIWSGTCVICKQNVTNGIVPVKPHEYNLEKVDAKYLKSAATCTAKAVYYNSCACGAFVKDDTLVFTDDNSKLLEHVYDQNKVAAKYLISEATCQKYAVYYKSCKCGAFVTGDDAGTFEDKDAGLKAHNEATKNTVTVAYKDLCVKFSYKEVKYCSMCDQLFQWDDFVAAAGHTAKDDFETDPIKATCQHPDIWYKVCKYCGADSDGEGKFLFETKWGDKNGPHVNNHGEHLTGNCKYYPSEKCDIPHIVTYTKTPCGKENCALDDAACGVTHISVPVLENPCGESNWKKDANGEYVLDYYCINCKTDITPDQHTYGEPSTVCGVTTEVCTNCEHVKTTGEAKHTYEEDKAASTAPTTETKGERVEVCSECGDVKKTELAKLPSLVFSLEIANPNGGDIVTGGKAYLTIKVKAIDVDVTSVCLKLNVDKYLQNVQVVADDYALGGYVVAHANANNVVTVWADANSEQKFVNLDGEYVLCVLAFDVVYDGDFNNDGIIDNDPISKYVSFVNPVEDDPKTEVVEEDPQIMVLNPDNERETFDVKTNNNVEVVLNQIADANNDAVVNSQDALIIRQAIEARLAGSEEYEYNSVLDINKDGEIGTADYVLVMQYIVGMKDYADLVAE